jgi:hypothetical protein
VRAGSSVSTLLGILTPTFINLGPSFAVFETNAGGELGRQATARKEADPCAREGRCRIEDWDLREAVHRRAAHGCLAARLMEPSSARQEVKEQHESPSEQGISAEPRPFFRHVG